MNSDNKNAFSNQTELPSAASICLA